MSDMKAGAKAKGSSKSTNRRNAPTVKDQNAHLRGADQPALHVLLGKTVEFLLGAGESRADVSTELARQAARIKKRQSACRRNDVEQVHAAYQRFAIVCGIVHDWHREPTYTDEQAAPRQLTPTALRKLVAKRVSKESIDDTVRWMTQKGVIRRMKNGNISLRSGRTVLLTRQGRRELALERAAVVVPQYLRIAIRNAESALPHSRDIDRDARVFSLPEKYVPLWRAMARERAQSFLEGMDNWLEDHAATLDIGPVREVAVHCYAYTADVGKQRSTSRDSHAAEVG